MVIENMLRLLSRGATFDRVDGWRSRDSCESSKGANIPLYAAPFTTISLYGSEAETDRAKILLVPFNKINSLQLQEITKVISHCVFSVFFFKSKL